MKDSVVGRRAVPTLITQTNEIGPVTETLAPSNTESFSAFIEQYYESLSGTNRQVVNSTIANDEAAPAANVNANANANGPIDLASPFEPNLFKPNSNSFTTPFKK
ncbi:hypothetical protein E3P80_00589 [Wallemia ichthyophaga]|nr:hypothetical protein E3P85_01915 [Wallemia ichthyophaga]TIB50227.1 hypothetical protein E3P82_00588 [Wallemia ichthyophaga]TIB56532.1 hypothetical protein E3P80_00589 [Wallemia ichthyophaga]TIB61532.1 hypothetical protein E3P79_00589 [Wallemia ichthyophaga]